MKRFVEKFRLSSFGGEFRIKSFCDELLHRVLGKSFGEELVKSFGDEFR